MSACIAVISTLVQVLTRIVPNVMPIQMSP
nr:MAG TPA: hypothetical protein [Caudoviricetes sp.]